MKTTTDTHKITSAFARLIAAASGPTEPNRIRIMAGVTGGQTSPACDDGDGFDKLHVRCDGGGRIVAEVGIATHWTTDWLGAFRPARTASGQLVLTGRQLGRQAHVWIEDGRLHVDVDTPFLSLADEAAAIAECASELAALAAEIC